jgi:hypothetical protein
MDTEMTPALENTRCQATTKAGLSCRAIPSKGSPYCLFHGPNAKAIQIKGGQHKANAHRLENRMSPRLKDVVELLGTAAKEVHSGKISPSQGSSLASIATALIKAVESASLEIRVSLLEVRTKRGDTDEFGS